MVFLRWAIPHTHNTGHLLAVNNTYTRTSGQDRSCDNYNYCSYTTRDSPISTPFTGHMDVVDILLCLRVSSPALFRFPSAAPQTLGCCGMARGTLKEHT